MHFFDKRKKKILVVDDSEIDLELVEMILEEKYTILPTKSGKEALDYILRDDTVDLVLLDLLMPEMDGWETFSRIRDLGRISHVPIAFLTSVYGTDEQTRAKELGAADYIMKPYTKEELLDRITVILKEYSEKHEKKTVSPNV